MSQDEIRFLDRNQPEISPAQAAEWAESQYGLTGRFTHLPSERDQNFRIDTDEGERYVFNPPPDLILRRRMKLYVLGDRQAGERLEAFAQR